MKITLKNLSRNYGSLHAVSDVSLEIPSNKIFGIIGRSGAGKSTLVRLISLLEKPDKGEVWYDDKRVDSLSEKELIQQRRHIGMIFQNFNLFSSRNAGQNVAYPMEICGMDKETIKKRVKELLELVDLGDRIDAPISTLSGGQKQRVAIARALACEPDILFCDEATSALDPQTTRSILELIKEIQKKMNLTVVMITHQMEVVRDSCDFVTVLSAGSVVESGTVKELFSKPKSEVTKDFLAHLTPIDADKESLIHWSKLPGRYTLRFAAGNTDSPIISKLSREFDVEINIRGGGIQKVGADEFGSLICDINGEEEAVRKAIAKLKRHRITVEENV
ncbi:MAG: methionine ABC transporter ATP-binding protein [Sphaerochaetaceae bacterium]|nr:methionine ABC transporter ATP-binding protein [Sphaerochaetaceae bacterium]